MKSRSFANLGALVLAASLFGCSPAPQHDPAAPNPANMNLFKQSDDDEKLNGRWATKDWGNQSAEGWQCVAGIIVEKDRVYLELSFKERGKSSTRAVTYSQPADLGGGGEKAWLGLEPNAAATAGLPPNILYRFDGGALILKVERGECQGEYSLLRRERK